MHFIVIQTISIRRLLVKLGLVPTVQLRVAIFSAHLHDWFLHVQQVNIINLILLLLLFVLLLLLLIILFLLLFLLERLLIIVSFFICQLV
jgi:hypothetical protein